MKREEQISIRWMDGKKLLLVASTGGHLAQLEKLSRWMKVDPLSLWVTFENAQSKSLLSGRRRHFIRYIAPRDWVGVARSLVSFYRILRRENFDGVVSTGSAVALGALPVARLLGVPAMYIESVSRFAGPSLSGRMVRRIPGISLRTQHKRWASGPWKFEISVMDGVTATKRPVSTVPSRVFVTLGTIKPYRFDELVDRLLEVCPASTEFVWQLGETSRSELPGLASTEFSAEEFEKWAQWADVVVTHAGVGTVLKLIELRQPAVVVPRRVERNEHVDNHQAQIASAVEERGLCVSKEAATLSFDDLVRASTICINEDQDGARA